jgi:hypothetical protein
MGMCGVWRGRFGYGLKRRTKMRKGMVGLLMLGMLAGCAVIKPESENVTTSNQSARITVLFTDADGYTVKKFTDNYRDHYYVTPGPARVITHYPSGKAQLPEGVTTVGAAR